MSPRRRPPPGRYGSRAAPDSRGQLTRADFAAVGIAASDASLSLSLAAPASGDCQENGYRNHPARPSDCMPKGCDLKAGGGLESAAGAAATEHADPRRIAI
jgi:putative hemolysin